MTKKIELNEATRREAYAPTSTSLSTPRAKAFRDRLAASESSITRWEIFASEDTKQRVKEIASRENLTVGVAAEALLVLGIASYEQTKAVHTSSAGTASSSASAPRSARQSLATKTVEAQIPTLSSYSSRTELREDARDEQPSRPTSSPAKPMQSFFDRAKKRKSP